jgi:hypothetical protein
VVGALTELKEADGFHSMEIAHKTG